MNFREMREGWELANLSPHAQKSIQSKGRKVSEEKCNIRAEYQRDRDRILHSKAFRRLKHKTQVYIAPIGDHYRTRLTHTLEVAQIARTIARALNLNEDLTEAIALGHDLGHTPFGHIGEDVLSSLNPQGFKHYEQSVRVVDFLEDRKSNRYGLNLTLEVLDGIQMHTGDNRASTIEGRIIKYSDRIAYVNHDIDDSIRGGILSEDDIPSTIQKKLGSSSSKRINTLVQDIIFQSYDQDDIYMSEDIYRAMMQLRSFMFERVYFNKTVKEEESRAKFVIEEIYKYYLRNIDRLPESHLNLYRHNDVHKNDSKFQIVSDYIAGMSDMYLMHLFDSLFIPKSWERPHWNG